MAHESINEYGGFLCIAIHYPIKHCCAIYPSEENLPELFLFKPERKSDMAANGWFGTPYMKRNIEYRKTVLEFCIYMTSC